MLLFTSTIARAQSGEITYWVYVEPAEVQVGDSFNLIVKAANTGSEIVRDASSTPAPGLTGDGHAELLSGPTPALISSFPPGAQAEFTYEFEAVDAGTVMFSVAVSGRPPNPRIPFSVHRGECSSGKTASTGRIPCSDMVEVFGVPAFTEASAFNSRDDLYWPDSTYVFFWDAGGAENIDLHASTLREPDPSLETDWTIEIVSGLEAGAGMYAWTIPSELESPTVWIRIRDSEDSDSFDMSERGRVRYGWHLYRVAETAEGELEYEAFDPKRHAWRDGLIGDNSRVFQDWVFQYYREFGEKVDIVLSETFESRVEHGPRFDEAMWQRAFRFAGDEDIRATTKGAYLRLRTENAERILIDRPARIGTPSWRSYVHALGSEAVYGSEPPAIGTGLPPELAEISVPAARIVDEYTSKWLLSGTGMCYGMAWSALAAFHEPQRFRDRFRALYPELQAVRELATLPITPQTLDIMGSALVIQTRSSGRTENEDVVAKLKAALETDGGSDDVVFGNGRHAVLPYRIEHTMPGAGRVYVHDRTLPTPPDRHFPADEFVEFIGDSVVKYGLTPERLEHFFEPVPPRIPSEQYFAATPFTSVDLSVNTASKGRYDTVRPVSLYRNDPDLTPTGFWMPDASAFEAAILVQSDSTGSAAQVSMSDGTSYAYDRPEAREGDVDSLTYAPGAGMTYLGVGGTTEIVLSLSSPLDLPAKQGAGEELLVEISGVTVTPTGRIGWSWVDIEDPLSGIRLSNQSDDLDYNVALMRSQEGDVATFSAQAITLAVGATHVLIPDWDYLESSTLAIDVDIGSDGSVDEVLDIRADVIGAGGTATPAIPSDLRLEANYPNPFSERSHLRFAVPSAGRARVVVHDVLGRQIAVPLDRRINTGIHEVTIDGRSLSSGVYYYRLEFESRTLSRPMLVVR